MYGENRLRVFVRADVAPEKELMQNKLNPRVRSRTTEGRRYFRPVIEVGEVRCGGQPSAMNDAARVYR